ncbi:hypothetical protein AAE478_008926 [Parahypoxylon ruwenzoriense]
MWNFSLPDTLPPKAKQRPPPPGETGSLEDSIDHLRDLVIEADQLSYRLSRLAVDLCIPQNFDVHEKTLEVARCAVRLTGVDWMVVTHRCEPIVNKLKEILGY